MCVQQQRQNKRTGARADKDGLPTPFDNHAVARLERGDVDLEGGEGEDVGRRVHRREELDDEQPRGGRAEEARAADHRVVEGAVRGIRVPHARLVRDERLVVKIPE